MSKCTLRKVQVPLQLSQSLLSTSAYINMNVKYSSEQKLQHKVGFHSLPWVLGIAGQVMLCFLYSEYHDDVKTEDLG